MSVVSKSFVGEFYVLAETSRIFIYRVAVNDPFGVYFLYGFHAENRRFALAVRYASETARVVQNFLRDEQIIFRVFVGSEIGDGLARGFCFHSAFETARFYDAGQSAFTEQSRRSERRARQHQRRQRTRYNFLLRPVCKKSY